MSSAVRMVCCVPCVFYIASLLHEHLFKGRGGTAHRMLQIHSYSGIKNKYFPSSLLYNKTVNNVGLNLKIQGQ